MTLSRKIWALLEPRQRRVAVMLLGLTLIGTVLETLGIGLVIPALAVMTEPDIAAKYPRLEPLLRALGHPTQRQLILGGMLALVSVNAIRIFFLAFLAWEQARFVYNLQERLSARFFDAYLRQPYSFHLQRNSAQLIRLVTGDVGSFAGAMISSTILVTELLTLVGTASLLLFVEPVGALMVISLLGGAAYSFTRFTKKRVLRWGEAWQHHETGRLRHVQQGLGGVKDVKLLGREQHFLDEYAVHNTGSARMAERSNALQTLPRLWLELLAVIGLAGLVLSVLAQGKPMASLIPTLGVFAAAAFRLMPSVNRVLVSAHSLRYTLPAIDILYGEMRLITAATPASTAAPIGFSERIDLRHISHTYEGAQQAALTDIDLTVLRGTCVGFVGGSGAGKSTLIDVILGLLTPTSGKVEVDGTDIQTNLRGWQDQVGYVPQSIYLTDDTLRQNVAFGVSADRIDHAAVDAAIRAAQLGDFVATLPLGLDTVVGERGVRLSGGQRQRIGIARALYHDPQVLVLDEATSALDTATEQGVMEAVNALQGTKTILIVAHRLSTVAKCDWLYRLENGRIVAQGTYVDVIKSRQTG